MFVMTFIVSNPTCKFLVKLTIQKEGVYESMDLKASLSCKQINVCIYKEKTCDL